MKIQKLIISSFLFSLLLPAYADILYLNSGEEINGKIEGIVENTVKISLNDRHQSYPLTDVLKIQFVNEYRGNGEDLSSDSVIKELMANPPNPKDYPDDGFITWLNEINIKIDENRNVSSEVRSVRYVLRERGKSDAALAYNSYLPGIDKVKIDYAFSITNSTLTYLNDISVQEGSEYSNYPEYDFLKSMKFAVPNVQIGSIIDYKIKKESLNFSTHPFFSDIALRFNEPVKKQRISVTVPKKFQLIYKEFNTPQNMVFSKKDDGDNFRYIWEIENVPSIKKESNMPPFHRYSPQIFLSLQDTWQNIKEILSPMINSKLEITDEMKKKAQEITVGLSSDTEKVEALYNWVAKEIKYVPVKMGDYSFIPKKTSEIFNSKIANSLDKPFLLYAMLKAAGFNPEFGYTQDRTMLFQEELPNIRQFSKGEVILNLNGKTYNLIPLSDYYRFNEMPGDIQGSYGFKILSENQQGIMFQNPILEPEQEFSIQTEAIKLDKDGNLYGNFKLLLHGVTQAGWRQFKDEKKQDIDNFFERYIHSIHPQAKLKDYKIENLSDLSKDMVISVSYSVSDYAMKAGKYMIFRVPDIEETSYDVGQIQREFPLFWYTLNKNARISEIEIPSGFELYYIPPEINIEKGGHRYSANYRTDNAKLIFNEDYRRLLTDIPASGYLDYKSFKEIISKWTENWIVLKER